MTPPSSGLPAWRPRGRGFWVGLVAGTLLIVWGIRDAVRFSGPVPPGALFRWTAVMLAVHDLLVVPVVLAVGFALRRVVPPVAWPPVRWALATAAVVAVVGWPYVRGYGRDPGNPSLLDRSYGTGVLVVIALTGVAAAVWTGVRARTR